MAGNPDTFKASYSRGLNDFKYCASLNVRHPYLDPDEISRTLHLEPTTTHRVGEQRRNPNGMPLSGVWDSSYWTAKLPTRNGEEIAEFLSGMAESLEPMASFLQRVAVDGGRTECFMGVFADGCCDQLLPAELLAMLGRLCVDLRIDYYGTFGSAKEE